MRNPFRVTEQMRSRDNLAAALAYVEGGCAVLALYGVSEGGCACGDTNCTGPGKHPITRFFSHGLRSATLDPATIGAAWEAVPEANIGLVPSGRLFIVDIDTEDARQTIRSLELPSTVSVKTGSGEHLYYDALEIGIPPRIRGVDYRYNENGYVVAPPSMHVSGKRYRWRSGADQLGRLPRSFFTPARDIPSKHLSLDPDRYDWRKVIEKYRTRIEPRSRAHLMQHRHIVGEADRSSCIFMIVAALHEAGAQPDEIAAVLWHSPYFISKHGEDRGKLNEEISRILSKLGGCG